MNQFARISSYLALLLVLLVAALAMNNWLHGRTQAQIRQLDEAAIALKRAQFDQAVAQVDFAQGATPAVLSALGRAVGATVTVASGNPPAPGTLGFEASAGPGGSLRFAVGFPPPPAARLLSLFHRVTLGLLFLCPVLFTAGFLIAVLARRRAADDRVSRKPWAEERQQALGIEHFAKMSNERTAALAQEQGARLRAEEDLQLNRTLLDNSVTERIRLGRELHDNICQTLYAVCLTLESVHKKGGLAPELQRRVEHCMTELKRLNQEVRAYLRDLEPARVSSSSFAVALGDLVDSFSASPDVTIVQRLDEAAVALIAPVHVAEIMNILREAVSNSLRHGRARHITVLVGSSEQAVALAIQDDGAGFNPEAGRPGGHGLGNMRARATALGADLRIESVVGKGTRVLLTLPVASAT